MAICLVGMPGCGKSSVGLRLASILGVAFFDTDLWIEQKTSRSIGEIFEADGEGAFRELEGEALRALVPLPGIVSTGGGSVLREANRELLSKAEAVIYLDATPEELCRRLQHDRRRPLLQGGDRLDKIRRLHEARTALYQDVATSRVAVDRLTAGQISRRLAETLSR